MAGSFLQTSAAQILRKCMQGKPKLNANQEEIFSFLSSEESEYAPQSGEITGILKEMGDEMSKDLTTATVEETTAIKDYEFAAAKTKEIDAISASITSKTQRIGELAVSIIDAISASIESKAHRIGELAVSIVQMKTARGFVSQFDPQGNGW